MRMGAASIVSAGMGAASSVLVGSCCCGGMFSVKELPDVCS